MNKPTLKLFIFIIFTLILPTSNSYSRNFYVQKEVTCRENICYFKNTTTPFHGELVTYDLNGKKHTSIQYKSGKKHGAQTYYYKDGKVSFVSYYDKGILNGNARSYFENGSTFEEVEYKDGLKEGPHRKYYEDGTLKEENFYNLIVHVQKHHK